MLRVYAVLVAFVGLSTSCTPDAVVSFTVPRTGKEPFVETPFPSDLLRKDNGTLDLQAVPNPFDSSVEESVLAIFSQSQGWSPAATMYFLVKDGIDESSLPQTPAASVQPDSAMFLVELDGLRRIPIEWRTWAEGSPFLPAGTVSVLPMLGALPKGRFALVVTDAARALDGRPLRPAPDLKALLTCDPIADTLRPVDCKPYEKLASDLGLATEQVALMQVITPQDVVGGLVRGAAVARAHPTAYRELVRKDDLSTDAFTVYVGTVELAQFQAGSPPFDTLDGRSGGFVIDSDGNPIIQRTEDVSFLVAVPNRAMPPGGFPIAVYGHGTGGDLETALPDSAGAEAHALSQAATALLAISEPLHRTRDGFAEGNEETAMFNFLNPFAGRDNFRQSALEKVQLVTLAQQLIIPADVVGGLSDVSFNPNKVSYLGHSQGSLVGSLFVAVESRIQGAFFSGGGCGFTASIVDKVDPFPVVPLLRAALSMPDTEEVDRFHLTLSLLQLWADPSDCLSYGDLWRHRSAERTPHLVVTSALLDTYTPKRTHGGLAAAFGLPLMAPATEEFEVLDILGIEPAGTVLSANVTADDGSPLTAGMMQFGQEGHFAIYENELARRAVVRFFDTLKSGVPSVSTQ